MKNTFKFFNNLWKDESGQGATEYILLLVVVVAIGLIFKDRIKGLVGERLEELAKGMGAFTTDPGN
jgi:Flp pilus assembly pilin Flp